MGKSILWERNPEIMNLGVYIGYMLSHHLLKKGEKPLLSSFYSHLECKGLASRLRIPFSLDKETYRENSVWRSLASNHSLVSKIYLLT